MKIVAHASPLVLEAELLDRVASAKSRDPLSPVLIVVPSRRLAEHVTRRLVERFGALLNVSVLHHRALAERVMEHAGARPRRVLEDDLLHTLLATVLNRAATGPLRDFVRDRPGAATALRETLTDLRDAGIDPAAATATLSGPEAETAALYARWSAALEDIARSGEAIDDAGLAGAAAGEARAFASRFSSVFHHGAYDLIGVRVDLLRALDLGRELTFFLPADPEGAAGAFGLERARLIAESGAAPARLERTIAPPPISFRNVQGAWSELRGAAHEALAAVLSGTPPQEVAVIVRSFGPYAGAMDALLHADGPRWHTSYTRPLRSDPAAATGLRAISERSDRGPRRFGDHADTFGAIANETGALDRLSGLLESLRGIETALGDEREVSRGEALAWLDARADAATFPPAGADGGGVRILDAMQARGLTHAHVSLVGLNSGIFPRVALEDPFLSDASRARLREATGRPLPLARESDGEERLILAMLLGSARSELSVSWQRADDAARPLAPSLVLRDIARIARPGADADAVLREASALPGHPRLRLEAWACSPGLLSREEETLLAALASETGADAAPAIALRRPELAAGLALIADTETFDPTCGTFDGRVDARPLRGPMSATALETLGRCPLQFFFRHVLRVEPRKTPPTPFEPDAATIGLKVHGVLRTVYSRLLDEGAFESDDVSARRERAREILREAWNEPTGEEDAARAARLPILDGIASRAWLTTLGAFLDFDLRRLADERLVPSSLEHDVTEPIPGGHPDLRVSARFDRMLQGPGGMVISDYKTGGDVAARVKPAAMLSGGALQVAIYALISGLPVELLGVGPRHDPATDVARFKGFGSIDEREGVLETIRTVVTLAASGRFPLHRGDHCRWCDFRSACRHGHPPTEHREDHADDTRDARDCWSKTTKAPSVESVRVGAAS